MIEGTVAHDFLFRKLNRVGEQIDLCEKCEGELIEMLTKWWEEKL